MVDIPVLIDLITKGGLVSALIIALVGGMKGWYVWKHVYDAAIKTAETNHEEAIKEKEEQLADCRQDRDYWRNQAVKTLSIGGRAVTAVEGSKKTE